MAIIIPFPKIHQEFTYHSEECSICKKPLNDDEPTHELIDAEQLSIYYVCEKCTENLKD